MFQFPAMSNDGDTLCLTIDIFEDRLVEGDENFLVKMSLDSIDQGVVLGDSETVVTIVDVDCKCAVRT